MSRGVYQRRLVTDDPRLVPFGPNRGVGHIVDDVTGCWRWVGKVTARGYGQVFIGPQRNRVGIAHRVYFERVNGPIPAGMSVDHVCRNRGCVNPAHLQAVTVRVNNRRQPRLKFSEQTAADLKARYAQGGVSQRALAREFRVSQATVWAVVRGATWQ